jgi:hypothetical protein
MSGNKLCKKLTGLCGFTSMARLARWGAMGPWGLGPGPCRMTVGGPLGKSRPWKQMSGPVAENEITHRPQLEKHSGINWTLTYQCQAINCCYQLLLSMPLDTDTDISIVAINARLTLMKGSPVHSYVFVSHIGMPVARCYTTVHVQSKHMSRHMFPNSHWTYWKAIQCSWHTMTFSRNICLMCHTLEMYK